MHIYLTIDLCLYVSKGGLYALSVALTTFKVQVMIHLHKLSDCVNFNTRLSRFICSALFLQINY